MDLDAANLLLPYGVTIEQLKEKQERFIKKHPGFTIHKCDPSKPYYNGAECVPCADPTPLFNVSSLTCTACGENSQYDAAIRQCKTLVKTNRYYTNSKGFKYILFCDDSNLDQVNKDIENEKNSAKDQPLVTLEECPEELPYTLGGKLPILTTAQRSVQAALKAMNSIRRPKPVLKKLEDSTPI